MAPIEPTRLGSNGLAGAEGGVIRLEPGAWVGQRLPLLPYIRGAEVDVSKGKWLVVLWHPHCGHCRTALPGIVERVAATGESTLLLNVSTRDEGEAFREAVATTAGLHAARLDSSHRWSTMVPQYLQVNDGRLVSVP